MKLYTRGGDGGETSLFDGTRVGKDHPRVATYGDVDELNSALGWCRCADTAGLLARQLEQVQGDLFVIGAHLATPAGSPAAEHLPPLDSAALERMENWIDAATAQVEPLRHFVLPGGTELAARLHLGRTICRRAEREVVALVRTGHADAVLVTYLNRLGDLLFAWARLANQAGGVKDVLWIPNT